MSIETKQLNYSQSEVNERLSKIDGTKSQSEIETELTNFAQKIGDITTFLESY